MPLDVTFFCWKRDSNNSLSILPQAFGSGRSISVWNLPAFERISRISTHASTQDILFDANHVSTFVFVAFFKIPPDAFNLAVTSLNFLLSSLCHKDVF